jgi:chromosome partitioning protein
MPVEQTEAINVQRILVINSKGGCGKSTIATNLASLYAVTGSSTVLMDYDPQGSSLQWSTQRPANRPAVQVIDASKTKSGQTRVWQTAVPASTERLIMDAPAGISGLVLQDMVRRCDVIVIPVASSPIDIHATSDFIRDLLLVGKIRKYGIHPCVIANRVRRNTPMYEPLKRFLNNVGIPFVTTLADTDNYIRASEEGIGIHELDANESALEREQWIPLVKFLSFPSEHPLKPDSTKFQLNVVAGGRA